MARAGTVDGFCSQPIGSVTEAGSVVPHGVGRATLPPGHPRAANSLGLHSTARVATASILVGRRLLADGSRRPRLILLAQMTSDLMTKGRLVMSKILTTATAIIMLGLTTMGAAHARAANYHDYQPWAHAGNLTFSMDSNDDHHVLQRLQLGAAHVDLGVRGYGCISHPDYGLYTPHFC
jgi:hypothetical protein